MPSSGKCQAITTQTFSGSKPRKNTLFQPYFTPSRHFSRTLPVSLPSGRSRERCSRIPHPCWRVLRGIIRQNRQQGLYTGDFEIRGLSGPDRATAAGVAPSARPSSAPRRVIRTAKNSRYSDRSYIYFEILEFLFILYISNRKDKKGK